VVLATPGDFSAIATTVAHLRRQTVQSQIELILVGSSHGSTAAPVEATQGFAAVRRVATGRMLSIAQANVAGARAASGRVVAFAEDHCFPDPQWAEALLRAHQQPHAVVGPVVRNGNPGSLLSWSDFLLGYGPWMEPSPAGPAPFLPGHNSSYKRDLLLSFGPRLESLMDAEFVLHQELAATGHSVWLEASATTRHMNYSLWRSWIPVQLLGGRITAGTRALSWSRPKRLFYTAASPLIPFVRFYRAARHALRPGRPVQAALSLPLAAIGLLLDAIGQGIGFLLGPGSAPSRIALYEYNRIAHVRPADRGLWD
jgi:hypothetical protein